MTTLFDLLFLAALFVPPAVLVLSAASLAFGPRQRQRPDAPAVRRAA